jgi:hypothetical protein
MQWRTGAINCNVSLGSGDIDLDRNDINDEHIKYLCEARSLPQCYYALSG